MYRIAKIAVLCAALLVGGAVSAASALAAAEYTTEVEPAALTGEQVVQNVLEITNSAGGFIKFKCASAGYQGTVSKKVGTEFALTPEWSTCTLGGAAASISFNGCRFFFVGTAVAKTFNLDVASCTTGKSITITKGNCTITLPGFPENQNLANVVFASAGAGKAEDSTGTFSLSLKSIQGAGNECPDPGLTSVDTKLSGSVTVKAFVDRGTKKASVNGHEFDSVICGEQVFFRTD
jgi:hypothetical protein